MQLHPSQHTTLDLSHNRLSSLPDDLSFLHLCHLNLFSNHFQTFPHPATHACPRHCGPELQQFHWGTCCGPDCNAELGDCRESPQTWGEGTAATVYGQWILKIWRSKNNGHMIFVQFKCDTIVLNPDINTMQLMHADLNYVHFESCPLEVLDKARHWGLPIDIMSMHNVSNESHSALTQYHSCVQ